MIEQCETSPAQRVCSARNILYGIGGAALLYLCYSLALTVFNASSLQIPPLLWAAIGAISTALYLLIIIYAIRLMARLTLSARQDSLFLGISLLLFLGLNPMVWQAVQLVRHGTSFWETFAALSEPEGHPVLAILVPFLLIVTGTFFGRIIARLIRERSLLVPVAIISGMIDFWGVYWGPVSMMSSSAPLAVSGIGSAATVAASVPEAAIEHLSAPLAVLAKVAPPDSIGIGDFVFLSLFLTCAYRLGFSAKRVTWGIFCGLLLASAIMALDGQTFFGHEIAIDYLPGLLFICGGVLLANIRAWKLSRQEWGMTGILIGLLAVLIGVSIVRAEVNKPRSASAQYMTTVKVAHELPINALAQIKQKNDEVHVVPLYGEFAYRLDKQEAHLAEWRVLAIGKRPQVKLSNTWEHVIYGMASKEQNKWVIDRESACPALTAIGYLAGGKSGKANNVALLRQARGLPNTAFRMLDKANTYAPLLRGQKIFIIRLLPDSVEILNQRGQVVKKAKYQ